MKKHYTILLLLPLLLAACTSHDDAPAVQDFYIQLQLSVGGSGSRADNPWGGEEDIPTYGAEVNESRINNALLIFYKKSLNAGEYDETTNPDGLKDADKVEGVMYFKNSDFETQAVDSNERTSKIMKVPHNLILTHANEYYVLVVTNITDDDNLATKAAAFKNMTLTALRDYTFTDNDQPMTYDGTQSAFTQQFKDFKMSSVKETKVVLEPTDKTDTYKLPKIEVQRLAARIDVSFGFEQGIENETHESYNSIYKSSVSIKHTEKKDNEPDVEVTDYTDNAIVYRVYEANEQTTTDNEYFVVTGIEVLNGRCTNTYLLKRTTVSDSYADTSWEVFGKEKTDASHNATNWVVSPVLNSGNTDLVNSFNANFENIAMNALHTDGRKLYSKPDAIGDIYSYYTVGYYAENTMAYSEDARYTKLKLKGYYCKGTESDGVVDNNFTKMEDKTYIIPIRHSDPTGTGADNGVMRYGIVRNNIYPIRITMVVKARDYVFVRYYYYPGGSTREVTDIATPFYHYIKEDTPTGTDGYPNDAPRKRKVKTKNQ